MAGGVHKPEHASQSRYGLISMIGIIVGTVIGSGIYIKNETLIGDTNSSLFSIIGWLIGGLIVLAMLIAFIEISSVTTKKKEQGTFSNWSRNLWGKKTSLFIGGYFSLFYFPLVITAETIFATEQIFKIDENGAWFGNSIGGTYGGFIVITILALVLLLAAYSLVLIFTSSGKKAQLAGTIIKTIPLFMIIIIALISVIAAGFGGGVTYGGTFDGQPNEIFKLNSEINNNREGAISILLIMPAILFAFDGFLFASSLSNEAKKPSTYKTAAIFAVFIITTIYILFSVSTYLLADVQIDANGEIVQTEFGINSVIHHLFNDVTANIIGTITAVIISLSILTATLGYGITSMWSVSDGSNTEEIHDVSGEFIKRNRSGIPIAAGIFILKRSILLIIFMRILDFIGLSILIGTNGFYTYGYAGMTNYYSDLFTLFNFAIYAFIIAGGIKNRFTNQVEVDKTKGFIPAAFFAMVSMIIIVFVFGIDIIYELFDSFASSDASSIGIACTNLFAVISFFVIYLYFVLRNNSKLKQTSTKDLKRKQIFKEAYENHLTIEEYVVDNNIDITKYGLVSSDLLTFDEKIRMLVKKEKLEVYEEQKQQQDDDDDGTLEQKQANDNFKQKKKVGDDKLNNKPKNKK